MKQFVVLIVTLLFAGCMTIGQTGYEAATDERSVGNQMDDAAIWAQIQADLLQSSVKGTNSISVFCRNGIVVLTGVVPKGSHAGAEALRIAHQVEGVKKVGTFFLPSQPFPISDFVIKEKIRFKMVGDSDLTADQIDMTVIDGHVVLVGVIESSDNVKRIIAIAHATRGVKAVISFIQTVPR
jgi:hyperosmotically inducible periplasmic protein